MAAPRRPRSPNPPNAPRLPDEVIFGEIFSHMLGRLTGIHLDPPAFDPLIDAIREKGRQQGRREEREGRQESEPREPRRERARAAPPPPPRAEDPRSVLGLPAAPFKLTEAMVRERRRKLTELFHPDATARGSGNEAGMKRINDAANALIAELKR